VRVSLEEGGYHTVPRPGKERIREKKEKTRTRGKDAMSEDTSFSEGGGKDTWPTRGDDAWLTEV